MLGNARHDDALTRIVQRHSRRTGKEILCAPALPVTGKSVAPALH